MYNDFDNDYDDIGEGRQMYGPTPMQGPMAQGPMTQGPIVEAPFERVVRRDICHEVQHVCPINTRIINNHIFRHVYAPRYTCCEQNVVTNVDPGSCCNFR